MGNKKRLAVPIHKENGKKKAGKVPLKLLSCLALSPFIYLIPIPILQALGQMAQNHNSLYNTRYALNSNSHIF